MAKVVLVHGAWHGRWCWDGVVTDLEARGVEIEAVELPFTSYDDDITTAAAAIAEAGPDAVVCGHSYGGCVISAAAAGAGAARLVYLCAFMLEEGEEPGALVEGHETALSSAMQVDEAAGTLTIDPARQYAGFYGDSTAEVAAACSARLRPMPFPDDWTGRAAPAWTSIPSTYVVCTKDEAIHPDVQRAMSTHADEVVTWDCDHSPFLTRPGAIANLLAGYLT